VISSGPCSKGTEPCDEETLCEDAERLLNYDWSIEYFYQAMQRVWLNDQEAHGTRATMRDMPQRPPYYLPVGP
jgi:hypothetical protein